MRETIKEWVRAVIFVLGIIVLLAVIFTIGAKWLR